MKLYNMALLCKIEHIIAQTAVLPPIDLKLGACLLLLLSIFIIASRCVSHCEFASGVIKEYAYLPIAFHTGSQCS